METAPKTIDIQGNLKIIRYMNRGINHELTDHLSNCIVIQGYTADRKYRSGRFEHFVKSGFGREPLDKQMIPHFKLLDVALLGTIKQPFL